MTFEEWWAKTVMAHSISADAKTMAQMAWNAALDQAVRQCDVDVYDGNDRSDGFNEFWVAYPRKVNKISAQRAWKRLSKRDKVKVMQHLQSRPWPTDRQFIPHASTFLNQRRFEDPIGELSTSDSTPGFF